MGLREGFSVVTVTNKKKSLLNLIQNYNRQKFKVKELIVIINSDMIKEEELRDLCKNREDIWIKKVSEEISLGECLNIGYGKAMYNYIAKFDDDDYYSEYYLNEAYALFKKKSCHIVCKNNIFYYLQSYGELIIIPSLSTRSKRVRAGAGATICMTKEIFKRLPYSDLRRGVDTDLFARARKMGLEIYTSTSYNFICIRAHNLEEHTWKIASEVLRSRGDRNFGIRKLTLGESYGLITQYPV